MVLNILLQTLSFCYLFLEKGEGREKGGEKP